MSSINREDYAKKRKERHVYFFTNVREASYHLIFLHVFERVIEENTPTSLINTCQKVPWRIAFHDHIDCTLFSDGVQSPIHYTHLPIHKYVKLSCVCSHYLSRCTTLRSRPRFCVILIVYIHAYRYVIRNHKEIRHTHLNTSSYFFNWKLKLDYSSMTMTSLKSLCTVAS